MINKKIDILIRTSSITPTGQIGFVDYDSVAENVGVRLGSTSMEFSYQLIEGNRGLLGLTIEDRPSSHVSYHDRVDFFTKLELFGNITYLAVRVLCEEFGTTNDVVIIENSRFTSEIIQRHNRIDHILNSCLDAFPSVKNIY